MGKKKLPTSKQEDSKDMISFEPNNTFNKSGSIWEDFKIKYNGDEELYDTIHIDCGDFELLIDKVENYPIKIRVFNFGNPRETLIFKKGSSGRFKIMTEAEAIMENL